MWTPEIESVGLLDSRGGPFSCRHFREAVVATVPGWRDASFGARAADGTAAAVPLLSRDGVGLALPPYAYGDVVSSRPLGRSEIVKLYDTMWRCRRLSTITIRWLDLDNATPEVGRQLATASVVHIDPDGPPEARYARLARRSLKRAAAAGAVAGSGSADEFWPTYAAAARRWETNYPEALVRRLVSVGSARVHVVRRGDQIDAVLLTLIGGSHWMCWLAAQTDDGRRIAASYLAYDAVFNEALRAGVPAVNLGASTAGGAEFKRHLGAIEADMREWTRRSRWRALEVRARRQAARIKLTAGT
jgi:Acetyltransferase (GNAT) domain